MPRKKPEEDDMNAMLRFSIAMFIAIPLFLFLIAADAFSADVQSSIENICEERGFASGATEQLFCLQFHKARNYRMMADYGPSLCFACTQICAEEREDYAACRARCERACGLQPLGGTAVAGAAKETPGLTMR